MSSAASKPPGREALEALSDQAIIDRVCGGEGALFEILMRRYNQRLYRTARAIVRDDAEAEDVMQQAWVNAYAHLHQFAERAKFSTWLTRIAIHEALARVRRRGRFTEIEAMSERDDADGGLLAAGPSPEQLAFTGELRGMIEGALMSLPLIYRAAFMLRDVEDLSTGEAAECLGVSEDTVKTRLHRARALLRNALFAGAGLAARDAFSFQAPRCDRMVSAVFARLELPPVPLLH